MKIYPSKRSIKEVECDKVNLADLSLACINIDSSNFIYYAKKEHIFTDSTQVNVKPYESFETNKLYLFDEQGEKVDISLKQDGTTGSYFYVPENCKEFVPTSFSYKIIVKKAMEYASDKLYDLAVVGSGEENFLKGLMPLFGDAPFRGLCPANISVNNKDSQLSSIWKEDYKNNDFFFIETPDGITFTSGSTTGKLDVKTMLEGGTNIWLCVDSFGKTMVDSKIDTFTYENNALYNGQDYTVKTGKTFDTAIENPDYPAADYAYINLFKKECPVLILHAANKGYIVVSPKSFMTAENSKLIYEIMMNIVLNGYYYTEEKNTWITDSPVDYLFGTEVFNRRHPNINLNDLLVNKRYEIDSFKIISVSTNNDNVGMDQINYKNDIFFKKLGAEQDPEKGNGSISVYTTKHSVLIYDNVVIKKIETDIDISTNITDNGHYITIGACKSSSHSICTTKPQTLHIKNASRAFYITYGNNEFCLADYAQYSEDIHGIKVALVTPIHRIDYVKYDTRISGGGLPETDEDNYNLADIGSRLGRPIRKGFSTVIRLPKKYKPYEDRIRTEVNKHAASGEFIAIVFENR